MTLNKLPADKFQIRQHLLELSQHFNVPEPGLVFKARSRSFYIFNKQTIVLSVIRKDYYREGFQAPLYHEFAHHLVEVRWGRQRRHHGVKFKQCLSEVLAFPYAIGIYKPGREYKSVAFDLRQKQINNLNRDILGI